MFAARLRESTREERTNLYNHLYDQLYSSIQDHPQLRKTNGDDNINLKVNSALALLKPFLSKSKVLLEIGSGEGSVSMAACRYAKRVYAVDVSSVVTQRGDYPENLSMTVVAGTEIPLSEHTVDVAYSDQMMEHLHPDDAPVQLASVFATLRSGGVYICGTPNRASGPHDISKYFDEVAQGVHLKDYTYRELQNLFLDAGFTRVKAYLYLIGLCFTLPISPFKWLEGAVLALSHRARRRIASIRLVSWALGARIIGYKAYNPTIPVILGNRPDMER